MFDAVVFARQGTAAETLRRLIAECPFIALKRWVDQPPSPYEAARIMNGFSPDIVFLELSDLDQALSVAAEIGGFSPRAAVIGFGASISQELRDSLAESGIHGFLGSTGSVDDLADAADRAIHAVDAACYSNLLVFLPGKAGSGSTLTALNLAGALKRVLDRSVLLLEADTRSGILDVLTDSQPRTLLQDILPRASQLTGAEWGNLPVSKSGVDLIFARRGGTDLLPQWHGYYQLLKLVCPRYDTVIVDLPEAVNDATAEIVRRAARTYVVCTPDLPSTRLGRQRCDELLAHGVQRTHLSVIMNRWIDHGITIKEFEESLGLPIDFQLPNDYQTTCQAILAGGYVDPSSKLGLAFECFARKTAGCPEPEHQNTLAGFFGRWRQHHTTPN